MSIVVEKYSGSSLASINQIKADAERVIQSKLKDHQMVVVVSARGKMTDELISRAQSVSPDPNQREFGLIRIKIHTD
jgi:aspartate kinase